jgi:hypothetical protein
MVEQDLMSIELVAPGNLFPNAIRKQTDITCKAQTSLGQSQKTHKLHLGQGLALKNRALNWMIEQDLVSDILLIAFIHTGPLVPNPIRKQVATVHKS